MYSLRRIIALIKLHNKAIYSNQTLIFFSDAKKIPIDKVTIHFFFLPQDFFLAHIFFLTQDFFLAVSKMFLLQEKNLAT